MMKSNSKLIGFAVFASYKLIVLNVFINQYQLASSSSLMNHFITNRSFDGKLIYDKLGDVVKLIKEKSESIKIHPSKEAIIVIGPAKSEKTAFVLFMADINNLILEIANDNNAFKDHIYCFKVNPKKFDIEASLGTNNVFIESKLPQFYSSEDFSVPIYNFPGLKDVTEEIQIDIVANFYKDQVIQHLNKIKIIVTISHCDLHENNDANFLKVIGHVSKFIKSITLFENSTCLIVTGVFPDWYNQEQALEDTNNRKQNVVDYLKKLKAKLLDQLKNGNVSDTEKYATEKEIKLINIFMDNTTGGDYPRIAIFYNPATSLGIAAIPLTDPVYSLLRINIKEMIEQMKFAGISNNDFNPAVPEYLILGTQEIIDKLNEAIAEEVAEAGELIKRHYDKKVLKAGDYRNLTRNLRKEQKILKDWVNDLNQMRRADDFFQMFALTLKDLSIPFPLHNFSTINIRLHHIAFLESIVRPSNQFGVLKEWTNPINMAVNITGQYIEWLSFLKRLHSFLSKESIQLNKTLFNVNNLNNWGFGDNRSLKNLDVTTRNKKKGLFIDEKNFLQFINILKENHSLYFDFNKINLQQLNYILPSLNEILNVTLRVKNKFGCRKIGIASKDAEFYAEGNYITLTEVNEKLRQNICSDLITVKVFAMNTIFIDDDLDFNGEQIDVVLIAPFWHVFKRVVINLSGKDSNPEETAMNEVSRLDIICQLNRSISHILALLKEINDYQTVEHIKNLQHHIVGQGSLIRILTELKTVFRRIYFLPLSKFFLQQLKNNVKEFVKFRVKYLKRIKHEKELFSQYISNVSYQEFQIDNPFEEGSDGDQGIPGGPGGNFLGVVYHVINPGKLLINTNGGNGGSGQNGAKGIDGYSISNLDLTKKPKLKVTAVKHKYSINGYLNLWSFKYREYKAKTIASKCENDFTPSNVASGIGSFFNGLVSVFKGRLNAPAPANESRLWFLAPIIYSMFENRDNLTKTGLLKCKFDVEVRPKHSKTPGSSGGKGGDGGKGGFGGLPGSAVIHFLNKKLKNFSSIYVSQIEGKRGSDGKGGTGGKGGYLGEIYNEIASFRTTFHFAHSETTEFVSKKNAHEPPYASMGESGSDGKVVNVMNSVKLPKTLLVPFHINRFKYLLRASFFESRVQKLLLQSFLNKIENNKKIDTFYDAEWFADEFSLLELQYLNHKNFNFISSYESIIERVKCYSHKLSLLDNNVVNGTSSEENMILYRIYTAAYAQKRNLNGQKNTIVMNVLSFLDDIEKNIAGLQNIKSDRIKSLALEQINFDINKRSEEIDILLNRNVSEDIKKIFASLNENIKTLLNTEVQSILNETNKESEQISANFLKISERMMFSTIFDIIRVMGSTTQLLGSLCTHLLCIQIEMSGVFIQGIAAIASAAIPQDNLVLNVTQFPEGMDYAAIKISETENLIEESKIRSTSLYRFFMFLDIQNYTATANSFRLNVAFDKIIDVIGNVHTLILNYKGNQDKINQVKDNLRLVGEKIEKIYKFEMYILGRIIPLLKTLKNFLANIQFRKFTKAGLKKVKMDIRNTISDVKIEMQRVLKGFKAESTILIHFERLDAAMIAVINLYDDILNLDEQKSLAQFIFVINEQKSNVMLISDKKVQDTILQMEYFLRINLVINDYTIMMKTVKLSIFPLAKMYSLKFDIPTISNVSEYTVANNFIAEDILSKSIIPFVSDQIKHLKKIFLDKMEAIINDGTDEYTISRIYSAKFPFANWDGEIYEKQITKLLSGEEIAIYSDINTHPHHNAIKFNEISVNFLPRIKSNLSVSFVEKIVAPFYFILTHPGYSHFRCDEKYYTISHIDLNLMKSIIGDNDFNDVYLKLKFQSFISPYTHWRIRLDILSYENKENFKDLQKLIGLVDLQLIGKGTYLDPKFKICDGLDEVYRQDYSVGEFTTYDVDKN